MLGSARQLPGAACAPPLLRGRAPGPVRNRETTRSSAQVCSIVHNVDDAMAWCSTCPVVRGWAGDRRSLAAAYRSRAAGMVAGLAPSRFQRGPDSVSARRRALLVVERTIGGAIHGRSRLLVPPLRQQPGVDRLPYPIESRNPVTAAFADASIAGDRKRGAIRRAGSPGQMEQMLEEDVVEHLHDLRAGKIASQIFTARHLLGRQLGDLPVPIGDSSYRCP